MPVMPFSLVRRRGRAACRRRRPEDEVAEEEAGGAVVGVVVAAGVPFVELRVGLLEEAVTRRSCPLARERDRRPPPRVPR